MTFGIGFAIAAFANSLAIKADDAASSKLTLTPTFDDRERFERRTNKGFSDAVADNRSDLFSRIRPGVKFKVNNLTGQVVYQYSHDLGWFHNGNNSTENSDLLLANVNIPEGDGKITVGRQRLNIGSLRMLEESNWNNISTTWDGVRFQGPEGDIFAASLGTNGKEDREARLTGFDVDSRYGKTLAFFQHENLAGSRLDLYSFDQYLTGKVGGLGFSIEGMAQLGTWGAKDVQAFASSVKVTRNFSSKFSATVEGDIASGGSNAHRTNQFTNFFGGHHAFDGASDNQGLSNVKEVNLVLNYQTSKTLKSSLGWYNFSLYDPTGGWINKNDTVNKSGSTSLIDATGGKGSSVGQEVDFDTSWTFRKHSTLTVGVADFIPGNYLKAFTGSGASKQSYWFFAQMVVKL